MNFPVGSIAWLFAHEIRLAWRGALSGRGGRRRTLLLAAVIGGAMLIAGVPLGFALRHVHLRLGPVSVVISDVVLAAIFTLMLSQTLAAATDTLYSRGDLDLLFSSPLSARKVLTVRIAAIAANVFAAFALLATPLLLPEAILAHPAWLAAYLVLAAMAMGASAVGLVVAMGLFRLIGPKRTRTVAQVLAAVIGAAFFLVAQARNILGPRQMNVWAGLATDAARGRLRPPPIASLPLRALLGDPAPAATLLALGALIFLASTWWIGARFAADAAAASGAALSAGKPPRATAAFATGAFAATVRKELRLLVRDAGLMAQVLLRLLYLAPLTFLVLRNASGHGQYALPAGVAAISFMAGQVAGSLTWITMSAEDAPELIACAPVPIRTLRRAKLAAALAPLVGLMAVPLVLLTVVSPVAGVAAILGCVIAALASGLINIWYQTPGKRSEFRRRRNSSWTATLGQFLVGALIAAAAGLAATPSLFALAPLVLAGLALLLLRRSEVQIADAIAAH